MDRPPAVAEPTAVTTPVPTPVPTAVPTAAPGASESASLGPAAPTGLVGGHVPAEVVEELVGRLAATEGGSALPASLRGPTGARAIGRQAAVAAGGLVAGAGALLVLMWLLGHLL